MSKAEGKWNSVESPTLYRGDNEKVKEWFNTVLAPYIKLAKNCGTESGKKCTTIGDDSKFFKAALPNGETMSMNNNNEIYIYLDTNGFKGPNKTGIDQFIFFLKPGRKTNEFRPCNYAYVYDDKNNPVDRYAYTREDLIKYCSRETDYAGTANGTCAALIMYDGWEIKDDYPIKF